MELRLAGDDAGDLVVIDRTAAGAIRVDVGADGTFEYDGASTVADTTRIVVNAGGGNDQVALNEAMGGGWRRGTGSCGGRGSRWRTSRRAAGRPRDRGSGSSSAAAESGQRLRQTRRRDLPAGLTAVTVIRSRSPALARRWC
jgi:hypothetical protein